MCHESAGVIRRFSVPVTPSTVLRPGNAFGVIHVSTVTIMGASGAAPIVPQVPVAYQSYPTTFAAQRGCRC